MGEIPFWLAVLIALVAAAVVGLIVFLITRKSTKKSCEKHYEETVGTAEKLSVPLKRPRKRLFFKQKKRIFRQGTISKERSRNAELRFSLTKDV